MKTTIRSYLVATLATGALASLAGDVTSAFAQGPAIPAPQQATAPAVAAVAAAATEGPHLAPTMQTAPSAQQATDNVKAAATAPVGSAAPVAAPASSAVVIATSEQAAPASPNFGGEASSPGDRAIVLAHELSAKAVNEADYTKIIDECNTALRSGLAAETDQYARRLLGWALNRRGEIRFDAGQDDAALIDFEEAIRNDATRWRALHNRGIIQATKGEQTKALADFNRTIELAPEYSNAYFNRGEILFELGRTEDAIKDYSQAIELSPSDAQSYNSRGHTFFQLGKYRDAARDFTIAIRIDPENPESYINRADLYADLGYYAKAVKDYQEAVKLDADCSRAYLSSAWLMATCPDEKWRSAQGAVDSAIKAAQVGADKGYRYFDIVAAAQANAGDFDKAVRSIEYAISAAPDNMVKPLRARLALYQKNQPFRGTPHTLPAEQIAGQPQPNSGDVQQSKFEQPVQHKAPTNPRGGANNSQRGASPAKR